MAKRQKRVADSPGSIKEHGGGRPRKHSRPAKVINVWVTVNTEPTLPRTASEVAASYRNRATDWPPGIGKDTATWLRAVAAALDEGDCAGTGDRALAIINFLEHFIFCLSPLITDGQAKRRADKNRGHRGKQE